MPRMSGKKKSANARRAPKRARPVLRRRMRVARSSSSGPAAEYRRILVDPCYAALPSTPYATSSGGLVTRTHAQVASSSIYQIVFYHPVFGAFTYAESTGAVAGSLNPYTGLYSFVTANGAARGIAGCLSATYSGPESSRSGMIRCGLVAGSVVAKFLGTPNAGDGGTIVLNSVGAFLNHVERMPVDKCEVNWVPGEGDSEFVSTGGFLTANQQSISTYLAKTNFAVVVVQGSALANSVDFACTSVYEYQAINNVSMAGATLPWDIAQVTRPSLDFRSVLTDLARKDSSWFLNTFRKTATLIGGTAAGYMSAGLPGALGYLVGGGKSAFSRQSMKG